MCRFSWPFFRFIFFFFPFPLYHHFSFSIAELQCHFKLSSYLILILLLWFLIFPDDDLHFFSTYTCQTLSSLGLFIVSPLWKYVSVAHLHICTPLWYFWSSAEDFLFFFPHFHGTEDKKVIKGDKRSRESCGPWATSRNMVKGMISILSLEFFLLCCFFPHGFFFFFN